MNTNFIKNTILASVVAIAAAGCVGNDDYDIPPIENCQELTSNSTIAAIKALNNTAEPLALEAGTIFEGYVASSDQAGNIYKTIYLQDSRENPTAGITINIDLSDSYQYYPVGAKIYITGDDLFVAKNNGTHQVGGTYTGSSGDLLVGRMDQSLVFGRLTKSCDEVASIVPTTYTNINDAKQESNIGTLIKLENVSFQSAGNGETFYDSNNTIGGATNVNIVDSEGNTIALRNSSYADFANTELPTGSGSITLILSAYSTSGNVTDSSYQAYIRSIDDVQITDNGDGGGTTTQEYVSCLSEDFESYSDNNTNFNNYLNVATSGTNLWMVRTFSDNKYIQLSAYNTDETVETYFAVPVDFDNADSFSFKTKDGYNNGDVLSVYYTTSWAVGEDIDDSTLTDITSSFTISSGNSSGYGDDFVASGAYDLSSVSGTGAIVFKYAGEDDSLTTTMQIDDISIVDNDNADCDSGDNGGGGTTGNLFEDDFTNLSNWQVISVTGEQVWEYADYGNPAPCARVSGYSNGALANEDWLVSNEIDLSGASSANLTFDSVKRYSGADIQVYYATNFTGDVSTTSWTELSPTLDTDESDWNSWTSSGSLDVSAAAGSNLYIAFKYTSDTSTAATWEIDNVVVAE